MHLALIKLFSLKDLEGVPRVAIGAGSMAHSVVELELESAESFKNPWPRELSDSPDALERAFHPLDRIFNSMHFL